MRVISIALGCDGVLADFCTGTLRLIEKVTGKKFDTSAVTGRDFTTSLGLNAHESHEVNKALGEYQGFAASLPRYPQARQGVRRLRTLGKVFCVTTPYEANRWWRAERESWLALHFGIDHVHHADNDDKTLYEADVFVDDNSDHIRRWLATWPGRAAVFWRTSQNTGERVPPGAHATESWEDLYQIAREVALSPIQQAQHSPMETP
jgi:5'(3')-deoxyribonucleotidase